MILHQVQLKEPSAIVLPNFSAWVYSTWNSKMQLRKVMGGHVLIVWKYMMLVTGHKNYACEALTFLSRYYVTLPPNLAEQLKWSRFSNTHGLPGHNVSCDLHLEHLNRLVKTAIEGLGANKSDKAIMGRSIGLLKRHSKHLTLQIAKWQAWC